MLPYLALVPAVGLAQSFVDNVCFDKVKITAGSVVYCDLYAVEHSGIAINEHQIVHLNGDGKIEIVSHDEFLNRLDGWNNAISIYVSSYKHENGNVCARGSNSAAKRAKSMIGKRWNYSLLNNNCHMFAYYCLTGKRASSHTFTNLRNTAESLLNANTWRVAQ